MSQFSFVTGEKSANHLLPRLRIEPATLRINTLPCRHNRVLYTYYIFALHFYIRPRISVWVFTNLHDTDVVWAHQMGYLRWAVYAKSLEAWSVPGHLSDRLNFSVGHNKNLQNRHKNMFVIKICLFAKGCKSFVRQTETFCWSKWRFASFVSFVSFRVDCIGCQM